MKETFKNKGNNLLIGVFVHFVVEIILIPVEFRNEQHIQYPRTSVLFKESSISFNMKGLTVIFP